MEEEINFWSSRSCHCSGCFQVGLEAMCLNNGLYNAGGSEQFLAIICFVPPTDFNLVFRKSKVA